jgi:mono/diheme cytochrome c family protein
MSDAPATSHGGTEGLWRWLLGGLVAGGIVLGLLFGAYAIGYHRGQDHAASPAVAAPAPVHAAPTTTAAAPAPAPAIGEVAVTPALVARGKTLFTTDGCSGCHSLSGAAGAGPSFKGLAGSTVALANGQSVSADDAYLVRSIVDPDGEIVKGYHAGLMPSAIASYHLARDPDAVRALVAFIKAQK